MGPKIPGFRAGWLVHTLISLLGCLLLSSCVRGEQEQWSKIQPSSPLLPVAVTPSILLIGIATDVYVRVNGTNCTVQAQEQAHNVLELRLHPQQSTLSQQSLPTDVVTNNLTNSSQPHDPSDVKASTAQGQAELWGPVAGLLSENCSAIFVNMTLPSSLATGNYSVKISWNSTLPVANHTLQAAVLAPSQVQLIEASDLLQQGNNFFFQVSVGLSRRSPLPVSVEITSKEPGVLQPVTVRWQAGNASQQVAKLKLLGVPKSMEVQVELHDIVNALPEVPGAMLNLTVPELPLPIFSFDTNKVVYFGEPVTINVRSVGISSRRSVLQWRTWTIQNTSTINVDTEQSGQLTLKASSSGQPHVVTLDSLDWTSVPQDAEVLVGMQLQWVDNALVSSQDGQVALLLYGVARDNCPPGTAMFGTGNTGVGATFDDAAPLQDIRLQVCCDQQDDGSSGGARRLSLFPSFVPNRKDFRAVVPFGMESVKLLISSTRVGDMIEVMTNTCSALRFTRWTVQPDLLDNVLNITKQQVACKLIINVRTRTTGQSWQLLDSFNVTIWPLVDPGLLQLSHIVVRNATHATLVCGGETFNTTFDQAVWQTRQVADKVELPPPASNTTSWPQPPPSSAANSGALQPPSPGSSTAWPPPALANLTQADSPPPESPPPPSPPEPSPPPFPPPPVNNIAALNNVSEQLQAAGLTIIDNPHAQSNCGPPACLRLRLADIPENAELVAQLVNTSTQDVRVVLPPAMLLPNASRQVVPLPVIVQAVDGYSSLTYTIAIALSDAPPSSTGLESPPVVYPSSWDETNSDGCPTASTSTPGAPWAMERQDSQALANWVFRHRNDTLPPAPAQNASCSICPAGSYSSRSNSGQCLLCPPGSYARLQPWPESLNLNCTKCSPGTFTFSWGSGMCRPCYAGTYAAKPESFYCDVCPPGFTTNKEGSSSCNKLSLSLGDDDEDNDGVTDPFMVVSFSILLRAPTWSNLANATGINASSSVILSLLVRTDVARAFNLSIEDVMVVSSSFLSDQDVAMNVTANVPYGPDTKAADANKELNFDDRILQLHDDPDSFFAGTTKATGATVTVTHASASEGGGRSRRHRHDLDFRSGALHAALWPSLAGFILLCGAGYCLYKKCRKRKLRLGSPFAFDSHHYIKWLSDDAPVDPTSPGGRMAASADVTGRGMSELELNDVRLATAASLAARMRAKQLSPERVRPPVDALPTALLNHGHEL